MKQVVQFLDIILTGLISGIIFGVWVGFNPQGLSAVAYVEQQQNAIRALNVLMPILGLMSMILTVVYAILIKKDKLNRNLLLISVVFLVVSGFVTRFGNQPINAVVITWDLSNIPDNWRILRDKWWTFHIIRTLSTLIGFGLIVWATLGHKSRDTTA